MLSMTISFTCTQAEDIPACTATDASYMTSSQIFPNIKCFVQNLLGRKSGHRTLQCTNCATLMLLAVPCQLLGYIPGTWQCVSMTALAQNSFLI